jgi:hypothetical protein
MRKHWTGGLVCLWVFVACGDGASESPGAAGTAAGSAGQSGGKSGGGGNGAGGKALNGGSGGEAGEVLESGGGPGEAGSNAAGSPAAGAGGEPGEPGSLLPSFASGTRLEARQLRYEDMPPVLLGFYDTELETDCSFRAASDGSLRCLPFYDIPKPLIAPQLFRDAGCIERVAIGDPDCVAARDSFVEEFEPIDCQGGRVRVYRAALLDDGEALFSNASGDCVAQGATNEVYRYFSVEELEPETFVGAELEVLPSPSRLSVERRLAEDGSYQVLSLADPEVNADCRVFEDEDDRSICVPRPEWSGRDYRASDDECSVPLSLQACQEPLYIVDLDVDTDEYVFFEAGPEHTGAVYGGVGACELVEDEGPFYTIGDAVPVSRFAEVTSRYAGTGRLRHRVYLDSAGSELAAGAAVGSEIQSVGGLFDTEFDDTCTLRRYTDLELYCMPDSMTMESINNLYYTDSGCTDQVAVCGERGCPLDVAMQQATPESGVCTPPADFSSVLTLGEAISLEQIYIFYAGREPGMQCDGPFSTDGYGVIREITGETGVEDFVRLTAD